MKRITALIISVLCLLFCIVGCSNTAETDNGGDRIDNEDDSLKTNSEYSLKFIEGKCEYHSGDEYVMLFFEFTNTSGSTAVPEDLVRVEAFQNGVGLTMVTFNGQRIENAIAVDISVRNGATATVVWMFRPDDYSDVMVETSDGQSFIVELMGGDSQLYKYSEYIKEEYLKDELLEWFSEYNIHYYDESLVEEFIDMDLPKPETAIADFPNYTKDDGSYLYGFDKEEECRVYLSAYMVYLMHFDYEITNIGNNVYSIDNEYYIGLGKIDGKYCFMIMEL